MTAFLIRWFVTAVAVMVAATLIPGIHCDTFFDLLEASLLLGIINAFVRPVLMLLSLPFIILTMGLFILVINALLLEFVSFLLPSSLHVNGFGSALLGALIISFVSVILSSLFRASDGRIYPITHHPTIKQANARVVK